MILIDVGGGASDGVSGASRLTKSNLLACNGSVVINSRSKVGPTNDSMNMFGDHAGIHDRVESGRD